jgi:hypothetical protein
MNTDLQQIQQAAQGLFFLSESDYPFEIVQLEKAGSIENELLRLANKPASTAIEKTTLDYFLRNMTRIDADASPEQQETAQRFINLQKTLKEKLTDIQVYRIGSIQIDAFIIGKLKDASFGGLRTKLIET